MEFEEKKKRLECAAAIFVCVLQWPCSLHWFTREKTSSIQCKHSFNITVNECSLVFYRILVGNSVIDMSKRNGEIPLPQGWELGRDYDGKVYFIDHNSKKTTWVDPRDKYV